MTDPGDPQADHVSLIRTPDGEDVVQVAYLLYGEQTPGMSTTRTLREPLENVVDEAADVERSAVLLIQAALRLPGVTPDPPYESSEIRVENITFTDIRTLEITYLLMHEQRASVQMFRTRLIDVTLVPLENDILLVAVLGLIEAILVNQRDSPDTVQPAP